MSALKCAQATQHLALADPRLDQIGENVSRRNQRILPGTNADPYRTDQLPVEVNAENPRIRSFVVAVGDEALRIGRDRGFLEVSAVAQTIDRLAICCGFGQPIFDTLQQRQAMLRNGDLIKQRHHQPLRRARAEAGKLTLSESQRKANQGLTLTRTRARRVVQLKHAGIGMANKSLTRRTAILRIDRNIRKYQELSAVR